jgi:FtsZ-binding cell division protein ZapB
MNANEIVRKIRTWRGHIRTPGLEPLVMSAADLIESLQAEVKEWQKRHNQAALNWQQENQECRNLQVEVTQLKDELADYNCDTKIGCKLIETVKAERDGQQPTKMFRAGITDGVHLDRLEEICNAEREGRCVVLPCKVGDTVYVIVHCDEVMKDCDDDYVTGTGEITCPFEGSCAFEECDDSNKILVETCVTGLWCESEGVWKVFFEHLNADIGVNDFGKTVFLTRAEAEAALKGAEHE